MSAKTGIDLSGGLLAAGLAVAFGGAAFFGLSHLATPANFSARLGRAEARITAAESILNAPARRSSYAAGAVCADRTDDAVSALKARVQSAATANGLTLASLSAAAGPPGQDGVALTPVTLQFEAGGRYDELVAMLGALEKETPSIFIDTADLSSQISSVDYKFSGRIYCSARL